MINMSLFCRNFLSFLEVARQCLNCTSNPLAVFFSEVGTCQDFDCKVVVISIGRHVTIVWCFNVDRTIWKIVVEWGSMLVLWWSYSAFMAASWWFYGILWDLPSGKRLQTMERSTIFNGKTHELSMAIFNS